MQGFYFLNNILYNAFKKYIKLHWNFSTASRITVPNSPGNAEVSIAITKAGAQTSMTIPLPVITNHDLADAIVGY